VDKSIDLGKLQSDLENAKRNVIRVDQRATRAFESMLKSQARYDILRREQGAARKAVDDVGYKVVQATRSVVED
jgi:hypothetical protein